MVSATITYILWPIAANILATVRGFLPSAAAFAILFTLLSLFSSQACNPGRTWWRNPRLLTDVCYLGVVPFIAPYLRMSLMVAGAALLSGVMSAQDIADYFAQGRGPLGGMPFWAQVAVYVIGTDFLLYWTHRFFHGGTFWRFHAIHHSAEQVDWTTAYRFHPVNLWLGSFLVAAVMLYLGVSPAVLLFLVPFDTTTAAFVHANLNWTLGPLKYVVATPVFHRWHHTMPEEGGNSNFGSLFSLWDVLFGTFYMPAHNLPARYGLDEPDYPHGFLAQWLRPFRDWVAPAPDARASAGPQSLGSNFTPAIRKDPGLATRPWRTAPSPPAGPPAGEGRGEGSRA
jgi:sterol desaturase/sphingolipid hydroxylase (fatty acid hydroxylase superfamily)